MLIRTTCPCCGEGDVVEVLRLGYDSEILSEAVNPFRYHIDITGKFFVILKCNNCGLYFQETVLDDEEAKAFYSKCVGQGSESVGSVEEVAHIAEDAMLIRLLFPDKKPLVLDFGMNTGRWAHVVSSFGCECYGTDIAEFSKEYAKQKGIKFVEFSELPDNYFDFINADQVFEHLAKPQEVLCRLSRALNHNGIIKISCPGDKKIEKKIKELVSGKISAAEFTQRFDAISPFGHINLFNEKSLVKLGEMAGLERFHIPLRISYATMILFNNMRQLNRNLYKPLKLTLARGTWQFFRKRRKN